MSEQEDGESDIKAILAIVAALKPLDNEARTHVLDYVAKRLGIRLATHRQPDVPHAVREEFPDRPTESFAERKGTRPTLQDIRSFAAEKAPRTVNEKVAVVGYYLANLAPEGERRDHLISDDIKTYFVQAGFELPTAPPGMTLTHAKNAGYLVGLDRGQYRLNAVGHNLVAHKLPTVEGSPTARKPAGKRKDKRKIKK